MSMKDVVNMCMKKQAALSLPRWIAHRGASQVAPENTLPALEAASRLGAEWVECDVCLDAYGFPLIFHDRYLTRTTNGRGRVSQYPYSVLETLDAGGWFDPAYQGVAIPSLEAWLVMAADLGLGVNLELKPMGSNGASLVAATLQVLRRLDPAGRWPILLSSASVSCLQQVRRAPCPYPVGWIADHWPRHWCDVLQSVCARSCHLNHQCLTPARIRDIKSAGFLLLAYTVNQPALARDLLGEGVDAVFTDDPMMLQ